MDIDPIEAKGWMVAAKSAIELFKSAKDSIPNGAQKDAIAARIDEADAALKRADVALAKQLRYHLCQCTFPPQIMLWKEKEKLYACPNAECGRTFQPKPPAILRNLNWL